MIAELIRLSVVYCNHKETVAKPKRCNSCLTLKALFWMLLRHEERSPEGLLVDEILDGVGGLKSCGCTEVWQGWNMLTLFTPVPRYHSHPSLAWSLGKLSTGTCFLFGSRGAHNAADLCFLWASIASSSQSLSNPQGVCLCGGRNSRDDHMVCESLSGQMCSPYLLFVWPWKVVF